MIFKSRTPLSPSVSITFGDVAVNYVSIQQLVLELGEGQHDLLRVTVAGIPPAAITDYDGAPVIVSWYQGLSGHEFRGYITHIEPEFKNSHGTVNQSPFQLSTIYCMGASFDMKAKETKLWDTPTLGDVVAKIAGKYQYSYSVPVDNFAFPRLAQNSESDWEFLVRVADSIGYSVTMHGTHIHIFDRYRAIGRQISLHLLQPAAKMGTAQVTPGQIISFDGTFGSVTPYQNSNSERITSLDARGTLITTNPYEHDSGLGASLPARFEDQISQNVVSPDYAERMIAARARKKFPYKARLVLTGTAGIKPGGICDVRGFSSNFDGLWYVESAKHTITFDKYGTEVTLLRDSTSDESFRIAGIEKFVTPPDSTYHGGGWKAVEQLVDIYA